MRLKQPKTGEFLINGFKIMISHPLPENIDLEEVFWAIKKKVPSRYFLNLDYVYVGDFPFLKKRSLTALYKDQIFYVSSDQDTDDDLVDDIIHETAHLVEEDYAQLIYEDGTLLREFLAKREELYNMLDSDHESLKDYSFNYSDFLNPEYDINFDNLLYNVIGYEQLVLYTMNIYYSPYGATSLREYFANGFEAFYHHRDLKKLKNLCPSLYNKLKQLEEYE